MDRVSSMELLSSLNAGIFLADILGHTVEDGVHQIPTGWGHALLKEMPAAGTWTWAAGIAVKEGQIRKDSRKCVVQAAGTNFCEKKSFLQAASQLCKVKSWKSFIFKLGFSIWFLVLKEHRTLHPGFCSCPWQQRPAWKLALELSSIFSFLPVSTSQFLCVQWGD